MHHCLWGWMPLEVGGVNGWTFTLSYITSLASIL